MAQVRFFRGELLRSTALQAACGLLFVHQAAAQPAPNAAPQGGRVVAGAASITTGPGTTAIAQSSNRAAIDWTSFNVGRDQSVTFQQPSSASMTLNRVMSGDPSAIAGRISANGQVVLTNPSGVTFYQGAQVNAQSVIVSTAGISNQNFMAGKMVFDRPGQPSARIENAGAITVKEAGLAALVAPAVRNSGVINARLGQVVLAGAAAHTLDMYGDGLVSIDVTRSVRQLPTGPDGKPVTALVTNTGVIRADGGVVQLTAKAADGVVQDLVRAGGQIRADSIGERTGRVEIAGTGGSVVIEGRVMADGRTPGTSGGTVVLNGSDATTVAAGALVSASGRAGGGTVAVGTSLARARGQGPAPSGTSTRTIVEAGARLRANATAKGDGGRVTVLSTTSTVMAGAVAARGGTAGGDGGTVELSGERGFRLTGSADTRAPAGRLGTVVIDPRDLTITATSNGTTNPTLATSDPNLPADAGGTTTDAYVTPQQIQALYGNVHLQATRDLVVASSFGQEGGAVTLEAGRNLTVNAGARITGYTTIVLTAAASNIVGYDPAGALTVNGTLTAESALTLNAGTGGIGLGGTITTGALALNTTGAITQTAGTLQANSLNGTAASVALPAMGNLISEITSFTVTGGTGDFVLTTGTALSVDGGSGTPTVSVQSGRSIRLTTDLLTLGAPTGTALDLSAPGGTVSLQTATAGRPLVVTTGAKNERGLYLTTAETASIGASVLSLGGAGSSPITFGQTGDSRIDLVANGGFGQVQVLTSGAVTQTAPITVNAFTGTSGALTLSNTGNVIPAILSFAAAGDLTLDASTGLTLTGTISSTGQIQVQGTTNVQVLGNVNSSRDSTTIRAGGNLSVASGYLVGSDGTTTLSAGDRTVSGYSPAGALTIAGTATSSTTTALAAGTGGIALSGVAEGLNSLQLTTTGSVTQSGGTVHTDGLFGSAGSVSLTSSSNAISTIGTGVGAFTVTAGDFTLVDAAPVTVSASYYYQAGLAVPNGRTVSLVTDGLTLGRAANTAAISAPGGTIALQPATVGRPVVLTTGTKPTNALAIGSSDLALMQASTLLLGGSGGVVLGQSGDGAIDLGSAGFTRLALNNAGAVTQNAPLAVATLSGGTGPITLANASNAIPTVDSLSTGGAVQIVTATGLAVTGANSTGALSLQAGGNLSVSGTTESQNGATSLQAGGSLTVASGGAVSSIGTMTLSAGTGGIALSGNVSALGALSLNTTGDVTQSGGRVRTSALAGSALSVGLTSATNAVSGIGSFTTTTGSTGDFDLVTGGDLLISGPMTLHGILDLRVTGNLTVTSNISAGSGISRLRAGHDLTFASGGAIFTDDIALSAADNSIAGYDATGALVINGTISGLNPSLSAGAGGIALGGTITGFNLLTFNTPGAVTQSAGRIRTGTIGGTAGSVALTSSANAIDAIGLNGAMTTTNPASGDFTLVTANELTIGNPSTAGGLILPRGRTATIVAPSLTINPSGSGTRTVSVPGGTFTLAPYTAGAPIVLTTGSSPASGVSLTTGELAYIDAGTLQLGGSGGAVPLAGSIAFGGAGDATPIDLGASGLAAVAVQASGAVTQTVPLTVGTLSGAVGTLDLETPGNSIGALAGLSAAQSIVLRSAALAVAGNVSGGAVTLTTVSGPLTQTGGTITAGTLTISAPSATLNDGNGVGTLGPVAVGGSFQLTNAQSLSVAGPLNAGSARIAVQGDLSLGGAVTIGNALTLAVSGNVSQPGGSIVAGSLNGITGSVALGQAGNRIGSLGALAATTGDVSVSATSLTVNGAVSGGNVSLQSASDLALAANVTAAGSLTLRAAGAITQPAGSLSTPLLTGSAQTASLTSAGNSVAALGGFSTTGDFTLTTSGDLAVTGAVDPVTITLNVGGALTLSAPVTGDTVVLNVGGSVTQGRGGLVTAGTLTGRAASLALDTVVNQVGTIGDFQTVSGFSLTAAGPLAVAGRLTDQRAISLVASAGALTLSGTETAPTMALQAPAITQSGGTVTAGALRLTSPGAVTQTQGSLTAGTLGGSVGSLALGQAGTLQLATLADISAAQSITLNDGTALQLSGAVTAPAMSLQAPSITQTGGSMTVGTLSGSVGSLSLGQAGTLQLGTLAGVTASQGITLNDGTALQLSGAVTTPVMTLQAPAITQTGGSVIVGTLSGSVGSLSLGQAGTLQLATLGGVTAAQSIAVIDGVALQLSGVTSAPSISLQAPSITQADGTLNAGTLLLTSPGAVAQTGGSMSVGTLSGSVGNLALGTLQLGTLADFSAVQAITLNDGTALQLAGAVTAPAMALQAASITQSGGTLNTGPLLLTSSGAITQTGGSMTIATLSGSVGSLTLGQGGTLQLATLGGVTAAQSIAVIDGVALQLSGVTSAPSISLQAPSITQADGTLNAGTLLLTSPGAVAQTGGSMSVGTLSGSVGSLALGQGGTLQLATAGDLSATQAITLNDGAALQLAGAVTAPAIALQAASITQSGGTLTTGPLLLTAPGAVTQTGGSMTVGTLSGSVGSLALGQGGTLQLATLADLSAAQSITLNDGAPLQLSGVVTAPSISLQAPAITQSAGTLDAGTLRLSSPGAVAQTGGSMAVGTLGGSVGSLALGQGGTLQLGTLADLSASQSLTLNDAASLQVAGPVSASALSVAATGSLTLNGGAIRTDSALLTVQPGAAGAASLVQLGTTSIGPLTAGIATVRLQLAGQGGTLSLNDLEAPAADLVLASGSGAVTGAVAANSLLYLGPGGQATLTGTIGGVLGSPAALRARVSPTLDSSYTLNGCIIAASSCSPDSAALASTAAAVTAITAAATSSSILRPDILTLDVLDLSVTRDRDDPTLLLPNVSDRDY